MPTTKVKVTKTDVDALLASLLQEAAPLAIRGGIPPRKPPTAVGLAFGDEYPLARRGGGTGSGGPDFIDAEFGPGGRRALNPPRVAGLLPGPTPYQPQRPGTSAPPGIDRAGMIDDLLPAAKKGAGGVLGTLGKVAGPAVLGFLLLDLLQGQIPSWSERKQMELAGKQMDNQALADLLMVRSSDNEKAANRAAAMDASKRGEKLARDSMRDQKDAMGLALLTSLLSRRMGEVEADYAPAMNTPPMVATGVAQADAQRLMQQSAGSPLASLGIF